MEAGALAQDGTTPVGAGDPQIREANIHAICMWLLKEEAGPIQVEEQQCHLLSDEEREEFRRIHLDCSRVCRGRCGFTNGLPKQAITTNEDADSADCLCVFGGASQCWVPARARRALTPAGASPWPANTTAGKNATGKLGSVKQVKGAQSEAPEAPKPAAVADINAEAPNADTEVLSPDGEIEPDEQGQQENPLQLAHRKYAPIKQFTSEQAEEILGHLTSSTIRKRIIARAVETSA